MIYQAQIRQFVVCILLAVVGSGSFADEYTHSSQESLFRSGYEYNLSIMQDEVDRVVFETQEEKNEYTEQVDQVARILSKYGSNYPDAAGGMFIVYSKLYDIDINIPLCVQYRYLTAVISREISAEQDLKSALGLLRIAKKMEAAQYPPFSQGVTLIHAASTLERVGYRHEGVKTQAYQAKKQGLALIVRAASLKGIKPEHREFVAYAIANFCRSTSSLSVAERETLCLNIFDNPEADQWVANYALGWLMYDKAWETRTTDWARLVNDARWGVCRTYFSIAKMHLTEAWELRPHWPLTTPLLIGIANAGYEDPGRGTEFWFDQGTSVHADLQWAYTEYAHSLTPNWGGSKEEIYALLDEISERSKNHEHMGYIQTVIMSLLSRNIDEQYEVFYQGNHLAEATRMMKEEIGSRNTLVSDYTFNETLRSVAMGCFMTGNYEDSAYLLKAGGGLSTTNYRGWETDERFLRYSPILSTKYSDELIRSLRASDEGKPDHALMILKEIQASMASTPDELYETVIGDPVQEIESLIEKVENGTWRD